MMNRIILAMFVLVIALSLASPSHANAAVIVGFNVGPVYAHPAYGYGQVYVHPRPYVYTRPYLYAPAYVYPGYGYRRFELDRRWDRRDYAYRARWERRRDWR